MSSMSSEDYVNIRQIGKGAFGTAHIVQHKVTGERFVLKRVRLARQSARERQSSVKELLLLSNLRHRNVLEFKGCWVEGGCNLCLLVELCESGDLFTQLRLRHPGSIHFSEEHLQEMAVQLLSALAYLHRSNIAHRDLKTANVLITGDGCLKLADFGLSTVLESEDNRLTKTCVGTPNYMSAEVLQERPYGTPNDIWGLGCVLFELSALKPAFQAFNMAGLIKKVTSGPPPTVPSCYSEHWRNLVRAMLTREPDMRPSAAELLELDWLQPAVRRVTARFGPELPPGAPELLEKLSDLPPDIMGLLDTFQAQEREEKRRADAARERRKAAVMKWDPLARAAAAAQAAAAAATKQPKLPPLKPHLPRKPPPRASRAPGGPGGLPQRAALLLAAGGGLGGGADGGPRVPPGAAGTAAGRVCPRRTTYSGEGGADGAVRGLSGGRAGGAAAAATAACGPPRRLPHTLGGAGTQAAAAAGGKVCRSNAAAAWLGPGTRISPPPLPLGAYPQQQRQHCDGHGDGMAAGDTAQSLSSILRSHRPSSAPPDSPVRRSRRGPRESASVVPADPQVSGRGEGCEGMPSLRPNSTRRTSSLSGDPASACSPSSSGAAASSVGGRASGAVYANEIVHLGRWQHQQPLPKGEQRQEQQRRRSSTQGLPQQPRQQLGLQAPTQTEAGLQEDTDATFRYLPSMRDASGLGGSGDGPVGSSASSRGRGSADSDDDDGDAPGGTEGGISAVRRSCPAAPFPRRSNSEMVLRVPRLAELARTKQPVAPTSPLSLLSAQSPSLQAAVGAVSEAAQVTEAATVALAPAAAAEKAAAAGTCGSEACNGLLASQGASRRTSETTSCKGGRIGTTATAPDPPSASPYTSGNRVASGASSSETQPGSSHVHATSSNGVGHATAAGAATTCSAVAQRRISSSGPGNRRPSGIGIGGAGGSLMKAAPSRCVAGGAGSRRSTATGSSLGLGHGAVPRPVSGTGHESKATVASAAATNGDGGREPPPSVILKPARPSLGLVGAGSRPSSASSSRPSSAKQQQRRRQ